MLVAAGKLATKPTSAEAHGFGSVGRISSPSTTEGGRFPWLLDDLVCSEMPFPRAALEEFLLWKMHFSISVVISDVTVYRAVCLAIFN